MQPEWQELTTGVKAIGRVYNVSLSGGGTVEMAEIEISIGQETASFTFTDTGSSPINVLQMFAATSDGVSAAIAITKVDFTNDEAQLYYSVGTSGNQPASWTVGTINIVDVP